MRWVTARRLFLIVALVLAAFVFMRFTPPETVHITVPDAVFRDVLEPAQTGLTWIGVQVNNVLTWPVTIFKAGMYNQSLEEEVADLKSQVIQINELKQENERLAALLDFKLAMAGSYETVAARVIGRDPGNWFGSITLNRGSRDQVRVNMAVTTPDGLVGRVVSVTNNTCEVLLITDPRSGVGALIQETRISGIVEGTTVVSGMTTMIHIPNSAEVTSGQVVITSGFGSLYPKNLPIGSILDIYSEPSGLFNSADVRPFADLSRLEEVLIILYTLE